MFRALFPRDTRALELVSSFALISYGLLPALSLSGNQFADTHLFSLLFCSSLGLCQLIGVVLNPAANLLRLLSSFICGCLFVHFAMVQMTMSQFSIHPLSFYPSLLSALFVGTGNLYGFVILTIKMRIQWKA
jgi:hypothetical protein